MSEVDFTALLNMDAENAVRPPAMPSGTYLCLIEAQEAVLSQKKNTPGIQFTLTRFEPQADVDTDKWQEYCSSPVIDPQRVSRNETFWLTPTAMWRLKDFCVKAGAQPTGPMGKLVSDAIGQQVLASVSQTVGSDGESVYNNIDGFAAVA